MDNFTFACFLVVAEFVTSRTLALGAAGQVVTIMRTTEIGQCFVGTFVHVGARLVTGGQGIAGRASTVGGSFRVDAIVRASKVPGAALVDICCNVAVI